MITFHDASGSVTLPILLAIVFLTLPVFVRYLLRYLAFRARLRALKDRTLIITQYEAPPHISPVFFGVLVDNRTSVNDMIAALLYLQQQNKVSISYDSQTDIYSVSCLDVHSDKGYEHEQFLLDNIPKENLSAKDYATRMAALHPLFNFLVLKDIQKAGYYEFHKNLENMNAKQYYGSVFFKALGKGLIKPWNWPGFILAVVFWPFGIAWAIIATWYHNRLGLYTYRTQKWEKVWPDITGYYNYLKSVEAERRQDELTSQKGVEISQHDPYLVAALMQPYWQKIFYNGKEIGAGGKEYKTQ